MKYLLDKQERFTVVALKEEKMDSRIAPDLKGAFVMLKNEGTKNVILDLSETKYADSSGLSALLVANRMCNDNDGVFVLCGLNNHVEKLMAISHLNDVLDIFTTQEEAKEAILQYLQEQELDAANTAPSPTLPNASLDDDPDLDEEEEDPIFDEEEEWDEEDMEGLDEEEMDDDLPGDIDEDDLEDDLGTDDNWEDDEDDF